MPVMVVFASLAAKPLFQSQPHRGAHVPPPARVHDAHAATCGDWSGHIGIVAAAPRATPIG